MNAPALTSILTMAVPKGRILDEFSLIMQRAGLTPEDDFFNPKTRRLVFEIKNENWRIVPVRSFDAATFVAFGGAALGVVGSDVWAECGFDNLYKAFDLGIGHCRLSLATTHERRAAGLQGKTHIRVATKYPRSTTRWFAEQGIQAECVKLNGAMELAPLLGLAPYIVDLVSTGATLAANGLEEMAVLSDVSSCLIMHKNIYKMQQPAFDAMLARLRGAVLL